MQKLDILHRIQVLAICLYWAKRVQWASMPGPILSIPHDINLTSVLGTCTATMVLIHL